MGALMCRRTATYFIEPKCPMTVTAFLDAVFDMRALNVDPVEVIAGPADLNTMQRDLIANHAGTIAPLDTVQEDPAIGQIGGVRIRRDYGVGPLMWRIVSSTHTTETTP